MLTPNATLVAMSNEAREATCYDGNGWSICYFNGQRYYVACDARCPKNGLIDWRYGFRYGYVADGIICRDAQEFARALERS